MSTTVASYTNGNGPLDEESWQADARLATFFVAVAASLAVYRLARWLRRMIG